MIGLQRLCRSLPNKFLGYRYLAKEPTDKTRNMIGMRIAIPEEIKFQLRQEYESNQSIKKKLESNENASKIFSIDFGDKNDVYNLKLYDLYNRLLEFNHDHQNKGKDSWNNRFDTSIPMEKDERVKKIAVSHVKMYHLKSKMEFNPDNLRGPQMKYHPHMEVAGERRLKTNRKGREEVIWVKGNYVRMKKAEFAKKLNKNYDSYYVYNREKIWNIRLNHSRNHFFFRYVYYDTETSTPLELHGKPAALMHRWTELKEERDSFLREIELEDILKYRHLINTLNMAPIFVPTHKLPKPKWFRNNTISHLTSAEIKRLHEKRKHNAISVEEEENVTIPDRPTQFNELISGWARTDQNVRIGSDFHFGIPEPHRDPIPLATEELLPS